MTIAPLAGTWNIERMRMSQTTTFAHANGDMCVFVPEDLFDDGDMVEIEKLATGEIVIRNLTRLVADDPGLSAPH